jgi:hypothetical protein
MKKIFAILALAITGTAFAADSFTVEGQHVNNAGAAAQQTYAVGIKKELGGRFAGDVAFSNTQTEGTGALTTRLEAGLTTTGPMGLYVRAATGQKYSNTTDFAYYSLEPGIAVPVGNGLTAKVGYRWRSAFDSSASGDQTHTARYSLAYALSKNDTIAVKYDRVNGDNNQKIVAVAYTRGF